MDRKLVSSLTLALLLGGTTHVLGANLNVDTTQDSPDAKPGCTIFSGAAVVRAVVQLSVAMHLGPGKRAERSTPRRAHSSSLPLLTGTPAACTRAIIASKVS